MNTAVFSMVNGFLLRVLPYPQPECIAALVTHNEGIDQHSGKTNSEEDNSFDAASWQALKGNIKGLTFASYGGGNNGVNLQRDAAAGGIVRYVHASRVSAHYFDALGIPMYRGRSFSEEEDRPHGPPVAVLSYGLWASTFGSDPRIIGKSVELKGEPYTVVGVLGPNAQTPGKADVLTPLQIAIGFGECGTGNNCGILVRLQPRWTWQQVNA